MTTYKGLNPPTSGIRPASREESAIHQQGWNASYDYETLDSCPYAAGTREAELWRAGWWDQDTSRRIAVGDDLERNTRWEG